MQESFEEFRKIKKQEKDPRVRDRILAVNMVVIQKIDIQTTADSLLQCPNWVTKWVQRYEEGGIDALRDLPREGRPPLVPKDTIRKIINTVKKEFRVTPQKVLELIEQKTNATFTMPYIRQLMKDHNMSPKKIQLIHVNRATRRAIQRWQKRQKSTLFYLEKQGFIIIQLDECFFQFDSKNGYKFWSEIGVPIFGRYTGNHKNVAAFGSMADNGQSFVRTFDAFNSDNFISYLKELHAAFGKVAIIVDGAPQHKSKKTKEFLKENPGIKLIFLPKGTPQLNAVEEMWRIAKLYISKQRYNTIEEFRHLISEYFRTMRFKLDIKKFIYRKIVFELTNLSA